MASAADDAQVSLQSPPSFPLRHEHTSSPVAKLLANEVTIA